MAIKIDDCRIRRLTSLWLQAHIFILQIRLFNEVDILDTLNPKSISFVHNALPDLSLNEINTTLKFGKPAVTIKMPILVQAETPDEAKALSMTNTEVPVIADNKDGIVLYLDGKAHNVHVGNVHIERVNDGIEAAKVIRTGGIPLIRPEQLGELQLYIKQLRIAMFLTNSKDINHLKKAPIYIMG